MENAVYKRVINNNNGKSQSNTLLVVQYLFIPSAAMVHDNKLI